MTPPVCLKKALKPIRAFDLVGFHPVQTEYDEKGNLYLKEDAERSFASFLETARKELKEMLMDTSYHQLHIRGKSRPDLMKREAAVRFVAAVFGGERK